MNNRQITTQALLDQRLVLHRQQLETSHAYALLDDGLYTLACSDASTVLHELPGVEVLPLFRYGFDGDYPGLSPLLVRFPRVGGATVRQVAELSTRLGIASWLWSSLRHEELAQHLAAFLDARLPNGERIVLQLYDPRQLLDVIRCFDAARRVRLLEPIAAWAYLDGGGQYLADAARPPELKTLMLPEKTGLSGALALKTPILLTRFEAQGLNFLMDRTDIASFLRDHEPVLLDGLTLLERRVLCAYVTEVSRKLLRESMSERVAIARLSRAHGPKWHEASAIEPILELVKLGRVSLEDMENRISSALTA